MSSPNNVYVAVKGGKKNIESSVADKRKYILRPTHGQNFV